jgi:MarR family transcriptional regulator, organic hydroperoxide resistance regulator
MSREIEQELKISQPLASRVRELALNLFRSERVLTHALEEALEPFDLRLDEFNVLRILRGAGPDGHERATVEERMVHDADRLLGLLHRLRQRGAVEGTLRLRITAEGRELLSRADPVFMGALEARIGGIPEGELDTAVSVLERIRRTPE